MILLAMVDSNMINTAEAAAYLGLEAKTLVDWRARGRGPAYVRADGGRGAAVRYRVRDLDEWAETHLVRPGEA